VRDIHRSEISCLLCGIHFELGGEIRFGSGRDDG
jgi:hypothetical protein